jgi:hypothetical protein
LIAVSMTDIPGVPSHVCSVPLCCMKVILAMLRIRLRRSFLRTAF